MPENPARVEAGQRGRGHGLLPAPTIVERSWDHPDGIRMRAAQREELTERYGTADSEPGPAPTAKDITVFYVAYRQAGAGLPPEPVGCGGLRQLDTASGEIKRMFVVASHRGTGVSVALLRALEEDGRSRGWGRLLLETGDRQPDAVRLYEREGFTRIPNFGHYAGSTTSLCYAKAL